MNDNTDNFNELLDQKLSSWSDDEVLENIAKFLSRVTMSSQFGEAADGAITHIMMVLQSGDSAIVSDPMEFEWPLQRMPMPDSLRGKTN